MHWCSPIPGDEGAVCDWFLHSEQAILTEQEWLTLQNQWLSQGQATECTTSATLGDIKSELEKLCSVAKCSYQLQKAVGQIEKIKALGEKSRSLAVQ